MLLFFRTESAKPGMYFTLPGHLSVASGSHIGQHRCRGQRKGSPTCMNCGDRGAKGNTEQWSEDVRQLLGLLAVEAFPFPSENCPSLRGKKGIW